MIDALQTCSLQFIRITHTAYKLQDVVSMLSSKTPFLLSLPNPLNNKRTIFKVIDLKLKHYKFNLHFVLFILNLS